MEPRIQYAQTADGVSIAFWTLGEGSPPLLCIGQAPFTHIGLEWQNPDFRRWWERFAQTRQFIRLDSRGSGLSERDIADYSLDAHLLDLEAVADRLGLAKFALYGTFTSGAVAIGYAARHPERVSHLILLDCHARGSDLFAIPQVQGLRALLDSDWEMYTETLANAGFGWAAGEPARRMAAFLRECATPEFAKAFYDAHATLDVTDLLGQLRTPTLVFQRQDVPFPTMEIARRIASRIPDARLVVLKGRWLSGEMEPQATAIDDFLSEGEEAPATTELPEGMAVLLFADIAESTALTEQLGDAAFRAKARELDTSLRSVIKECAGTPVEGKVLGDGVLAVFTSARQAIDCALRCDAASQPLGLQLHLGIHAGDVIREGNNVYGGAVNIAARIAAASAPGEVLVSDTVRSLGRTSADVTFDDRGEHELKGVGEPQRLFAVRGGG